MFAGHVGAGLAIGRFAPRVNAGVFVGAALLLDLLLWPFALLGWESVALAGGDGTRPRLAFVFPWTHGLAASLGWSAAAALAGAAWWRADAAAARIALLVAVAVFSHWLLDALVHPPELPLLGERSPHVGLGLWNELAASLVVEAAVALGGLWLFLRRAALPRARAIALAGLVVAVLALTVAGMTVAPSPPSPVALASSSLATLLSVCALAAWLGRRPASRVAPRDA